jgi:MinD superfamily P-loop ATPase
MWFAGWVFMIISIASGKGGTGKTTVATGLAATLRERFPSFLDCDVEAPNAHLFLKPIIRETLSVPVFRPVINANSCTVCGECASICRFGALVRLPREILVLPEQCHACLGCRLVCPTGAIHDGEKEIGVVSCGASGGVTFFGGRLHVGQALAPPLIRAVKKQAFDHPSSNLVLVDAPPGASCPAVEAIRGSDFVLLVTEPTPFGLHDLRLAVEMTRALVIPFGVVINRATIGNDDVRNYCRIESIPILLEIPDDRRIAEGYASGRLAVEVVPDLIPAFRSLCERIVQTVREGA